MQTFAEAYAENGLPVCPFKHFCPHLADAANSVTAKFIAKAGKEDQLKEALIVNTKATVAEEKGFQKYILLQYVAMRLLVLMALIRCSAQRP